jgi:hypothetical protein
MILAHDATPKSEGIFGKEGATQVREGSEWKTCGTIPDFENNPHQSVTPSSPAWRHFIRSIISSIPASGAAPAVPAAFDVAGIPTARVAAGELNVASLSRYRDIPYEQLH